MSAPVFEPGRDVVVNYKWGEKSEIWPQFSTPVPYLSRPRFETEQHISNVKQILGHRRLNYISPDVV